MSYSTDDLYNVRFAMKRITDTSGVRILLHRSKDILSHYLKYIITFI